MSKSETLYVNPDEAIELYDQLRHLFDNNECTMEFKAYIAVVQRLSDLKERVHYCKECMSRYFRPYHYSCDKDPPKYQLVCQECTQKVEAEKND